MAGNRSPNYPSVGLGEAVEAIRKLYKSEKRSAMAPEVAAHAMGYNALHGPARSRISALRKYGLLDSTADGLRISDAAITILVPPSDEERTAALRDAALRPELFRDLASQPGASDANLIGRLVRQGFTEAGARAAVASFRSTWSLAGSEDASYDPVVEEDQDVLDQPSITPPFRPPTLTRGSQSFVFPLPNGVQAQIAISSGVITKQVIERLERYLTVAKEMLPNEEDVSPPSPQAAEPTAPEPPDAQSPTAVQD